MVTLYIFFDTIIPGRLQDVDLLRRPNVPQGDRLSEGAGGAQAQVTDPREAAERERPRAQPEEGQAAATEQVRGSSRSFEYFLINTVNIGYMVIRYMVKWTIWSISGWSKYP